MTQQQDEGTVALVSAGRLAKLWDTTPSSVRRLLAEAGVPAYRLSRKAGGTLRYHMDDVVKFLEHAKNGESLEGACR